MVQPASGRRKNGRLVLLFLWVMGLTQLPMLWYITVLGAPAWVAVAIFVCANATIVLRVRMLPHPDPPPVWFERRVIGPYFVYSVWSLYFTPGLILGWLVGAPEWTGGLWLALAGLLALRANGVPWRPVAVRRIDIAIPGLPKALNGITLAHLTDLHAGPYCNRARLDRWVRLVNREAPDFICLTGDLIASGDAFIPQLEGALAGLISKRGTFAVMGNHDYFEPGQGTAIPQMLERLGIRLLWNEHILVEEGLALAGVGDTWRGENDLDAALAGVPDDVVVLLLAHDPETFPAASERGIALQLSGHLHGGQMAVPFLGRLGSPLRIFAPFVQGIYRLNQSVMYLSAGLGTTGAPVRIGMSSELPILRLVPKQAH